MLPMTLTSRRMRNARAASALGLVILPALLLAAGASSPSADRSSASGSAPAGRVSESRVAQARRPTRAMPASFERAVIIPIEDEITDITLEGIKHRLERVKADNVPLVIFEMNTPGGALEPTLEICTTIRDLREQNVRSIVWVNKNAYSAGTIIALAADGIAMARNATMGDCQPIMITTVGAEPIPEGIEAKAISPILAELRHSARDGGYPMVMVTALVRPGMKVFWIENLKTGERRFADARERDQLFGLDTPMKESTGKDESDGKSKSSSRTERVEPIPDSQSKTDWRYVKQDSVLGQVEQPIIGGRDISELLTMRDNEALAYGFSMATLGSREDLRSFFHITGPIDKIETTYMETFIAWLASPLVRSVLFVLMLLGAYAEFHAPGLSLAGAVALIALVLFLGAPYLAGYTVTWEIVAVLLGLVLIAVELFLIPGFGVAGILGLLLLGIGLIASFVPAEPPTPSREGFYWPQMPQTYTYFRHGLYSLATGLTGGIIGMVVLARFLPKVPVAGRIIAPNPQHDAVQADDPYAGIVEAGDRGRSETLLRPAGKARFGEHLVDVVSMGDYIEPGVPVEVVERHGSRVVVRQAE